MFIYLLLFKYIISFYTKSMDHIYKNIYLGNYLAAENENLLKMYDIYTVLNFAAELYN